MASVPVNDLVLMKRAHHRHQISSCGLKLHFLTRAQYCTVLTDTLCVYSLHDTHTTMSEAFHCHRPRLNWLHISVFYQTHVQADHTLLVSKFVKKFSAYTQVHAVTDKDHAENADIRICQNHTCTPTNCINLRLRQNAIRTLHNRHHHLFYFINSMTGQSA